MTSQSSDRRRNFIIVTALLVTATGVLVWSRREDPVLVAPLARGSVGEVPRVELPRNPSVEPAGPRPEVPRRTNNPITRVDPKVDDSAVPHTGVEARGTRSEFLVRQIEEASSLGGYRSVFVPSLQYNAGRAIRDSRVNPNETVLSPEQKLRVQEIIDGHNPEIVATETRMAELAEAAFREAVSREQYRVVPSPMIDRKLAKANQLAALEELDATFGKFREGYWYQSFSGHSMDESLVLYFKRADSPEFFQALERARLLRTARDAALRAYFSGL